MVIWEKGISPTYPSCWCYGGQFWQRRYSFVTTQNHLLGLAMPLPLSIPFFLRKFFLLLKMSLSTAPGFLALIMSISACSLVPTVQTPIFQNERGTVALRTFSDPGFKASHPKTLESTMMFQVLQGLRVQEQKDILTTLMTGEVPPTLVFSPDQIIDLAPLLTSAFSQATAEEHITFLITDNSSNERTLTEGKLFIEDSILYLSMSQYRTPIAQTALLSQPSASFNRPNEWELKFYPVSALQNQTERIRVSNDDTILNMLHIDYNRLSKLTESREEQSLKSPTSHPAISESSRPDPENQEEIDALKKEVGHLKESLRGQDKKLQELENKIHLESP